MARPGQPAPRRRGHRHTAYLGLAALDPFLDLAAEHGKGVIIVARSSSPEGSAVQTAVTVHGTGVGGTTPAGGFHLSRLGGPILAPGFAAAAATWRPLGKIRDVVRQSLVGDQLTETVLSLGSGGCRVLDVGCGQGTQSLRLARQGHRVVGLDSSADLLARLRASLEAEPAPVRPRGSRGRRGGAYGSSATISRVHRPTANSSRRCSPPSERSVDVIPTGASPR